MDLFLKTQSNSSQEVALFIQNIKKNLDSPIESLALYLQILYIWIVVFDTNIFRKTEKIKMNQNHIPQQGPQGNTPPLQSAPQNNGPGPAPQGGYQQNSQPQDGYQNNGFNGQNGMQQNGQQAGNETQAPLVNVVSYSFSGNHLLELSLVFQRQNKPAKKHYYCFIKLLPAGKNGNERTYISDKHITMKISLDRILEFANALRAYANGRGEYMGQFTTFTDTSIAGGTSENTNAGKKSVSVFYAEQNGPNGRVKDYTKIMVKVAKDSENYTMPVSAYLAGSIATIAEKISTEGLHLEFERQKQLSRDRLNAAKG